MPLISTHEARRAQIQIAVANYKKHFGRQPRGIWLAECAYEPGVEDLLKDAGIEYFISDTHAILYGDPRPRLWRSAPVVTPNGTAVFARDVETSQQVWSAEIGYPGNDLYREFYRDIGWDAPLDYLKPHLHADGNRRHLGLKYHRITGRDVPQNHKEPYIPALAREKAAENAAHFIGERIKQAHKLRETFEGHPPLVVSPYDAELYGHWWYEGPQFIDFFFKKIHFDQNEIAVHHARRFSRLRFAHPGPTAHRLKLGRSRLLQSLAQRRQLVDVPLPTRRRTPDDGDREQVRRGRKSAGAAVSNEIQENAAAHETLGHSRLAILNQMARELLLAQSSDWAFQIYQGTTVEYSSPPLPVAHPTLQHARRNARTGEVDHELLAEIENRDNIFPEIDYKIYRS